jgi:hypothetical protein
MRSGIPICGAAIATPSSCDASASFKRYFLGSFSKDWFVSIYYVYHLKNSSTLYKKTGNKNPFGYNPKGGKG